MIGSGVGSWRGSEFGKAVGQGGKLSLHLGGTTVEGHSEIFRFVRLIQYSLVGLKRLKNLLSSKIL